MDTLVRKLLFTSILSIVTLVHCEPPISNQYGVPGNYAVPGNALVPQGGGGYSGNGGYSGSGYAGNGNNGYNGGGGDHGGHGGYDNGHGGGDQDYVDNQPKSYEFGYAVKDAATGNDFGRQETSDGDTVRGEYRVQLPDGRTQIVTYTADWRTGFHADVRYEGTATYPDQYNTGNGYSNGNGGGYNYPNGNGGGGGGGYNYQPSGGNFNNQAGGGYPSYQFGSNSLDNSYNNLGGGSRNSFPGTPSPAYGPAFH